MDTLRPICFEKAQSHVKKDGIIVVDDSWRYLEIRHCNTQRTAFKPFIASGLAAPA